MDVFEKTEYLNELFSRYQSLLTDKQVEYFKLYYHMDYSLQEIAQRFNVSRNAIHDQLKKVEEHLYSYEDKLNLNVIRNRRMELIDKYLTTLDVNFLEELRKLDE